MYTYIYEMEVDINPSFYFLEELYACVLSASKSVDVVEKFLETKSFHVFRLKILLHHRSELPSLLLWSVVLFAVD